MYLNVRLDAFWQESQGNHIGLIIFLPLLLCIKGLSIAQAKRAHSWFLNVIQLNMLQLLIWFLFDYSIFEMFSLHNTHPYLTYTFNSEWETRC